MSTIANPSPSSFPRPELVGPPQRVPTRPFSDIGADDLPYAGVRGVELGVLTRTGLRVPPGFVVGVPALRLGDDRRGMRAWLQEAIGVAYESLCCGERDAAVAVRPSPLVDREASPAFLNARGREHVIEAVRRCHRELDVAVVVQREIGSTRAGVMMTADPASSAGDRLLIAASVTLAVGVKPDRYLVDKNELAVTERFVGADAALTDEEVLRVAELGIAIEREYRCPQEIEWAFDPDDWIWMLQSRPIANGSP